MIEMYETLDGGDYRVSDDGIIIDNSLFTECYLAFTGGNIEENTEAKKPIGVLNKAYWGNIYSKNDDTQQFNSNLERVLSFTPISSGNLSVFESAAEQDLEYLVNNNFAESIEVEAFIVGVGLLKISVTIEQPSQSETETYSFLWKESLKRFEIV